MSENAKETIGAVLLLLGLAALAFACIYPALQAR